MKHPYFFQNWKDKDGNPSGGVAAGIGFALTWQNGPLGRGEDRKEPNGAFVETLIDVVIKRLDFYQDSKFKCDENAEALYHLRQAALILDERTKKREARNVEGTHTT